MKYYKRLTKWSKLGTLHVFGFNGEEISLSEVSALDVDNLAGRLAELEDKIESGELGDVSEYKKHRVLVEISPVLKGKECISVPNTQPKIIQLYNAEEVEQIAKERDEYKHRAEVAERALKNICKNIRIDSGDKEDEIKANSNVLYKAYLKQAEKELQEGKKE